MLTPMVMRDGELEHSQSRARPVQGSNDLPASADVVVVGAGMLGIASALALTEKGLSVVICEKGVIAGEQSSRAYGQVTNYGLPFEEVELIQRSKKLWSGMNERIGADTSFRAYGRVQACANDEDVAKVEAWLAKARTAAPEDAPIKARFLQGAELAQRLPGATTPWKTALIQDDDGSLEPAIAASVLAQAAIAKGVRIVTDCAVRGIETQAGAISGVVTEKGAVRASAVIVAGGSWTRLFCGNAGVDVPLLPVYLSQQRISAIDGPPACGAAGRVVWRKEIDGSYSNGPRFLTAPLVRDSFALAPVFLPKLMSGDVPFDMKIGHDLFSSFGESRRWALDEQSPFEQARTMAPTYSDEALDTSLGWLRAEFPVFEQARVIERWGGALCVANDMVPIISGVDTVPGLFVTSGFTFGLTQGPAAGELMADLVAGDKPKIDPSPYRLDRFHA